MYEWKSACKRDDASDPENGPHCCNEEIDNGEEDYSLVLYEKVSCGIDHSNGNFNLHPLAPNEEVMENQHKGDSCSSTIEILFILLTYLWISC